MDPFDIHDPSHSPQAGLALDIHADIDPGDTLPGGVPGASVGHGSGTPT